MKKSVGSLNIRRLIYLKTFKLRDKKIYDNNIYPYGETTMQILEDNIEADNLYLLDEPEVSLSPQN